MLSIGHYLFLSMALFLLGRDRRYHATQCDCRIDVHRTDSDAVNINLVAFFALYGDVAGQVFALFIIADAAAEAAVGLGIIIAFFRNRETVLADEMDLLKVVGRRATK